MSTPAPVAIIEQLDDAGHVVRCEAVRGWPYRLGRALDCDFVTSDEHVAALHAELDVDPDGHLTLHAKNSVNGVQMLVDHDGVHVAGGQSRSVTPGQPWRMGVATYRIRLADDPLAPEVALPEEALSAAWQGPSARSVNWSLVLGTAAWGLAAGLWLFADQWLDSTVQTRAIEYIKSLLKFGMGVGAWVLVWAMVSKLFVHRLMFLRHLRTALTWLLLALAVSSLLPLLGFMIEAPMLSKISLYAGCALLAVMIARHLGLLMPAHRGWIRRGVFVVYALGVGAVVLINQQQYRRYLREPYMSTLGPPALRLARPQGIATLLDAAKRLEPKLQRQSEEEEEDPGGDSD